MLKQKIRKLFTSQYIPFLITISTFIPSACPCQWLQVRTKLQLFYQQRVSMNRSKFQHSMSELYKIKNQIRVELNQIRQTRQQVYPQRNTQPSKKIVRHKNEQTDPTNNYDLQPPKSSGRKRTFQKDSIVNADFNKVPERRHFGYKFVDKVDLSLSTRKLNSSYLRIKTEGYPPQGVSPIKQPCNTSLWGVGANDRSPHRSGKRMIYPYHVYKGDLI